MPSRWRPTRNNRPRHNIERDGIAVFALPGREKTEDIYQVNLAINLTAVGLFVAWGVGTPIASAAEPAHEHGVGILNVAIEEKSLIIELEAPGVDIVGFEHAPKTERDKQAVHSAVETLKDGATLIRPNAGAACRLEDVDVSSGLLAHAPSYQGERGHDEHVRKNDQETHAAFRVLYRFTCSAPEKLTHLDLTYFRAFPRARELDARIITASGQSARELTANSPRLKF